MALIKCPECGKEVSDTAKVCIHCGFELSKNQGLSEKGKNTINNLKNKFGKKKLICFGIVLAIIILALIVFVFAKRSSDNRQQEENKAIKIDITMNSWYGSIEYILQDFDLEFYAVTSGANCYSGVTYNQFETEKYGVLYTEFTYCKSTEVQRFRIYN